VSNRAGFQDAAFGANIGLTKVYFYEECSYRVKQFCSEFLVPFFDICIESRNIIFLTAFGVDFLAKKSQKGNLRLYIGEDNLGFTAVSINKRLIATLKLDDLVASSQLTVL
jgi:hypothetical protein